LAIGRTAVCKPLLENYFRSIEARFSQNSMLDPLRFQLISAKGENHELHLARHQGSEARAA
jgi:hypothetical protein